MQMRMGQINQGGFLWNNAPGVYNPYAPPVRPQIPNTFGGAPAAYSEPIAAGPSCFTCTNPSTGDSQFGVPAATADKLKASGYRCRKDDCASRSYTQETYQGAAALLNPMFGGGQVAQGLTSYAPAQDFTSAMSGRIPLSPGIGRRALS